MDLRTELNALQSPIKILGLPVAFIVAFILAGCWQDSISKPVRSVISEFDASALAKRGERRNVRINGTPLQPNNMIDLLVLNSETRWKNQKQYRNSSPQPFHRVDLLIHQQ